MKINRYIRGYRKGKEANRLEKEAMHDPFLADALEGFDKVKANHTSHIVRMRRRITMRNRRRLDVIAYISIAASLLVIVGFSYYYLSYNSRSEKEILAIRSEIQHDEDLPGMAEMQTISPLAAALPDSASKKQLRQNREMIPPATEQAATLIEADLEETVAIFTSRGAIPAVGTAEYTEYLLKHFNHPSDETCASVKGVVILTFEIDEKDRPVNIQVQESLCPSIDQEAIRLLKEGPGWSKTADSLATIRFTF